MLIMPPFPMSGYRRGAVRIGKIWYEFHLDIYGKIFYNTFGGDYGDRRLKILILEGLK